MSELDQATTITDADLEEANGQILYTLGTSGWKQIMKHGLTEIIRLDMLAMRWDISDSLRLFTNGQRAGIQTILRWGYELTGVPHPYDEDLGACYGRLGIDQRLRVPQPRVPKVEAPPRHNTRGRGAGIIA